MAVLPSPGYQLQPSAEAEVKPEVEVPTPTEEKAPEPVKPMMVVDALGKKARGERKCKTIFLLFRIAAEK